jgi:hypothetical protein
VTFQQPEYLNDGAIQDKATEIAALSGWPIESNVESLSATTSPVVR